DSSVRASDTRSGSRQRPRLAFWLRACALHPAYSVRGSPSRSTVSNSPPGLSGLAMWPSMPAPKQRPRSPLIASAVGPTIGTWPITHLFFLRRELVHRRPPEVDAGRLLEGVGDREQFRLAVEPAGERDRERQFRLLRLAETVGYHHGRMAGQV